MSTATWSNTQFIDVMYLQTFGGLRRDNALDYFYLSPFFDENSNNQLIRTQGVSVEHLKTMGPGIEYALDEMHMFEPHIYVIRKQKRISPEKVELLEIYYIIDGYIYQSPNLLDLLRSRIGKTSCYLKKSFDQVHATVEYTDEGHRCLSVKAPRSTVEPPKEEGEARGTETDVNWTAEAVINMREFPSFDSVINDLSTF